MLWSGLEIRKFSNRSIFKLLTSPKGVQLKSNRSTNCRLNMTKIVVKKVYIFWSHNIRPHQKMLWPMDIWGKKLSGWIYIFFYFWKKIKVAKNLGASEKKKHTENFWHQWFWQPMFDVCLQHCYWLSMMSLQATFSLSWEKCTLKNKNKKNVLQKTDLLFWWNSNILHEHANP